MMEQEFVRLLRTLDNGRKADRAPWQRDAVLSLLVICRGALRFEEDYRILAGEAPGSEENPETYAAGGKTYFPPEFRWECLQRAAPEDKKELVWQMLRVLAEAAPDLRWLLEYTAWLDEIAPRQLDALVQGLDAIFFQVCHDPPPDFETLLRLLLNHYPVRTAAQGRRVEVQPQAAALLAELFASCGPRVYDPCCGAGNLLLGFADSPRQAEKPFRFYGHEADENLWRLAAARMYLWGLPADLGDGPAAALDPQTAGFTGMDVAVANPPVELPAWRPGSASDRRWFYGVPTKKQSGLLWLQHMLSCLGRAGVMAIFLKRTALSSANRGERQIRLGILDGGLLEAVILLPEGLFYRTRVSMSLWILRKGRSRAEQTHVLMMDAEGQGAEGDGPWLDARERERICEAYQTFRQGKRGGQIGFWEAVPVEEIRAREGDLDPKSYLRYREGTPLTLEELTEEERALTEEVEGLLSLNRQILWRLSRRGEEEP